jgi:hypothetical protein
MMVLTRAIENSTSHEDIIYENEDDFADRQNATENSRSFNEESLKEAKSPRQFNYGSPCPPIC